MAPNRVADPPREHAKLDVFLAPFSSLPLTTVARGSARRFGGRSNGRVSGSDRTISRSPRLLFNTT